MTSEFIVPRVVQHVDLHIFCQFKKIFEEFNDQVDLTHWKHFVENVPFCVVNWYDLEVDFYIVNKYDSVLVNSKLPVEVACCNSGLIQFDVLFLLKSIIVLKNFEHVNKFVCKVSLYLWNITYVISFIVVYKFLHLERLYSCK